MSGQAPQPTIAYLAQGKVHLKAGATAPRTIDSAYGNALFLLHLDGRKERLLNEQTIEQVFFVPG
jgi:hypothetical protein